jgi:hypothetical protein
MVSTTLNANLVTRFRDLFTTRDFIFHDGRDLKRFSVAGRTQAILAGVAAITVTFSAYGVSQAAFGAIMATGVAGTAATPEARMEKMRAEMTRLEPMSLPSRKPPRSRPRAWNSARRSLPAC